MSDSLSQLTSLVSNFVSLNQRLKCLIIIWKLSEKNKRWETSVNGTQKHYEEWWDKLRELITKCPTKVRRSGQCWSGWADRQCLSLTQSVDSLLERQWVHPPAIELSERCSDVFDGSIVVGFNCAGKQSRGSVTSVSNVAQATLGRISDCPVGPTSVDVMSSNQLKRYLFQMILYRTRKVIPAWCTTTTMTATINPRYG